MTVLVADVVESTRLNAALGEERSDEVRRILFSRFEDASAAHGGTLIKTMGDGCLVTYGGASEGVASGVEMLDTIDRLARQVPGLQLRVGVAVGDVTEEDNDVFGPAVVVASRLCSQASPGQLLATDIVRSLAGTRGGFEWERVGDLFLKGIEDPVPTSAARSPRSEETRLRLPRPLRTRPAELFVGRHAQYETLVHAWKETLTGERRAVVVSGEPGVGKTRLVAKLARRTDEDGALVLFGRCAEDLAVPYQPFADALRLSVETAPRDLLSAHVAACGGELRRLFPNLAAPDPVEASPEAEQLRLIEAISDLLTRLSREQPLVLVLDDIHWAAPATIQVIRHLISIDEPAPIFLVATFRDTEVDRRHPLGALLADVPRLDSAQRISLEGLDRGEVEELVETASGDPLTPDGVRLADALFDRTAGNPFFANQVMRHMAEAGVLVYEDGRWQATGAIDAIPAGVLDVVERRLSRLDDSITDVLSLAAVAGLSFTRGLLARAAHIDGVDDALDRAVAARLLTENGRGGFMFAHAIVRDALLRSLTASARALRHRDIALALVEMGRGDDALFDLAYHYCGAALLGFTSEAAHYAVAAAQASIDRADVAAAIEILERAWKLLDDVDPIDHEARFAVTLRLAQLHFRLLDGTYDALEAAAASARTLRSPEKLVEVASCSYRWDITYDDPFGLALIDDALALLPPGPSITRATAFGIGAYLRNMQTRDGARELYEAAFRMIAELGEPMTEEANEARKFAAMAQVGHPGAAEQLAILEGFDLEDGTVHAGFERSIYLATKAELHIRVGDRPACERVVAELKAELARTAEPTAGVYARGWDVIRGFIDGNFEALPQFMLNAQPEVGVAVPNIAAVYAAWSMWLAYEEGRSAEIIDGLRMLNSASGDMPAFTSPYAVHLTELGLLDEARTVVESLVAQIPSLPRNAQFSTIVGLTAVAAAGAGASEFAEMLLAELDPYAGEIMMLPSVVAIGAADRFRGQMLSLLGRHDDAIAALEAAIALETKLGAPPFVKRSQYWLDRAIAARP